MNFESDNPTETGKQDTEQSTSKSSETPECEDDTASDNDGTTNIADTASGLKAATREIGLSLSDDSLSKLQDYCDLLWEWNQKINLTRHTTYDLFARRDLLDSIELAKHLEQQEDVLDVGTGGGVPGLLLAILRPDLTVSVCDSVAKKSKVVEDIVNRLDLPVAVYAARVQDVVEDLRFHSLVTRAVGSLSKLLTWLDGRWLNIDRLLAIKGPKWIEERGEARHRGLLADLDLRKLSSYAMPGTESESVILQINKKFVSH